MYKPEATLLSGGYQATRRTLDYLLISAFIIAEGFPECDCNGGQQAWPKRLIAMLQSSLALNGISHTAASKVT